MLNTYTGGYDENYIPPIREGVYEFIKELSEIYKIILFTSRNLLLASEWVINNNLKDFISNITNVKEPSVLLIDDRVLTFTGDYDTLKKQIENFQPWYK